MFAENVGLALVIILEWWEGDDAKEFRCDALLGLCRSGVVEGSLERKEISFF